MKYEYIAGRGWCAVVRTCVDCDEEFVPHDIGRARQIRCTVCNVAKHFG